MTDPSTRQPFLPQQYVHLAHSNWWPRLNDAERLCANQLTGLMINDLFQTIEHRVIVAVLENVTHRSTIPDEIATTITEEKLHLQWFNHFNQQYSISARSMISTPNHWQRPFESLMRWRVWAEVCLWLTLLTEEWATYFAKSLRSYHGTLDTAYVDLHWRHFQHERRHVALGARLIDELAVTEKWQKQLVSRLLGWILRQVMVPRRGITAMVAQLCQQHPRLQTHRNELTAAAISVGKTQDYWRSLLPIDALPLFRRLWHQHNGASVMLVPGVALYSGELHDHKDCDSAKQPLL